MAEPHRILCDAILFDMDGTLLNSDLAIDAVMVEWSSRVGLNPQMVTETSVGRRIIDIAERLTPPPGSIILSKRNGYFIARLPIRMGL